MGMDPSNLCCTEHEQQSRIHCFLMDSFVVDIPPSLALPEWRSRPWTLYVGLKYRTDFPSQIRMEAPEGVFVRGLTEMCVRDVTFVNVCIIFG